MNSDIDWTRLGEAATFAAISASAAMAVIRARLGRDFATHAEINKLSGRLDELEGMVRGQPTDADLSALVERVQKVEVGIGVVQASQGSILDAIKRVEHLLDLLLQDRLRKEGE